MRRLILKEQLEELPVTFFCIHGNHEERPENIPTYKEQEYCGGIVYIEEQFPSLIFAKDGEIYNFDGKSVLTIGGAYSVDKFYRLANDLKWFESEQIPDSKKAEIDQKLAAFGNKVDYVLSHTCPYYERPVHLFLSSIDQRTVDSSMEVWLQKVSDKLDFSRWYFGHYHDDWDNGKYSMLLNDIIPLGYKEEVYD